MRVVVNGAGIGGLTTALLLASDGHEVTVLERDPAPAPDPSDAWEDWDRRGVNQFRLPHFFLPRYRAILEEELPGLLAALDTAGMLRFNILDLIPVEISGGRRDTDDMFELITGKRSAFEAVIAGFADEASGIEVRRGSAVTGLLIGANAGAGVPHVTGVKTDDGDVLDADLVVDATGRRSALPRWLDEIGAAAPFEELEDCGFTYYGRHFRSDDGSIPAIVGPLKQDYGSISVLTLPADNGSWSVVLVTSARDETLRKMREIDIWTEVVRALPLAAHWLEGTPIEDRVATMSKIEDRHRRFSDDDGEPIVNGVVAVADSWACTNPSLGRGASMGALHALGLRDLLRTSDAEDPGELAASWNRVTDELVEPWYRSTLDLDRHRLNQVHAEIDGRTYAPDDVGWTMINALGVAGGQDPECLRALFSVVGLLRTPEDLFSDPALFERVASFAADGAEEEPFGPDRKQLLEIVSGN